MRRPGARGAGALAAALAALAVAPPVRAELPAVEPDGFVVRHQLDVPVDKAAAYARLLAIARWWDPAHTYSGRAESLSLAAAPGGCFCEQLADGGFVEHLRVVLAQPGTTLRLAGALGPLQELGVSGALTFTLQEQRADLTRVTLRYAVSGRTPKGLEGLAKPVDFVLGRALQRYATSLAAPDAARE